jgi:hypothetical protein
MYFFINKYNSILYYLRQFEYKNETPKYCVTPRIILKYIRFTIIQIWDAHPW